MFSLSILGNLVLTVKTSSKRMALKREALRLSNRHLLFRIGLSDYWPLEGNRADSRKNTRILIKSSPPKGGVHKLMILLRDLPKEFLRKFFGEEMGGVRGTQTP